MHLASTALALLLVPSSASDRDWPQYNGSDSTRIAAGELTPKKLDAKRVAWRSDVGSGFSSFAVADGLAFTVDRRDIGGASREVCVALDAKTGKERWTAPLGSTAYDGGGGAGADGNKGGDGPRSTPSVADGRVYVYDAGLVLHALDARSGKERWSVDVAADYEGRNIKWQNASSPVVHDGRVFVAGGGPGESLLAFDAKSGELEWAMGDEKMTHATPVVAELHGETQVIFYVQSGLVALDPATGAERWRIGFPYRTSSAASPVVHGDIVYVSAGYGVGGAALRVTKSDGEYAAEYLWHKRNKLMNHWSTPVAKDGYLYGMYGFKDYGDAPLTCVELATGEIKWEHEGFGQGNVILVGEHLVALGDAGQVVIADADPAAYTERARLELLDGKCWSSPAFADGRLFVRSTQEAACVPLD